MTGHNYHNVQQGTERVILPLAITVYIIALWVAGVLPACDYLA